MSKTKENLLAAFAGESQARNKYTYFAKVARKEGYNFIARIFEETAANEEQHAKEELKLALGIGNTVANLKEAIGGEHYEHTSMYPEFAKIAREEGNDKAAKLFEEIAKIEKKHEARFKKLLEMLESESVFKREKKIAWKCSKCGHIHIGEEAPDVCPCCHHPKAYFEPECICFESPCECMSDSSECCGDK